MPFGRTQYRFGLFEVDVERGRLLRQGQPLRLQEQPFQVLVALLERHGELVSRDSLRERLWPGDTFVEFDKSLSVALAKVRAALGDDAASPRFIETIPKRGYRFIAPVAALDAAAAPIAPTAVKAVADTSTPPPTPTLPVVGGPPVRRWLFGIAAALVFVVVGAGAFAWKRAHAVPAPGRISTIVAEFNNSTGDEVFAGSLRRAAMIALGQSPFVTLIDDAAIADTLQALGRAPNDMLTASLARDVCARTRGSVLVSGDISLAGDTYTLVVDASQCADGRAIAHENATFTKKDGALPALGQALRHIRQALGESGESLRAYDVPIQIATTNSLEALQAFHLGMNLRTKGDRVHAIPALKTAVALDPQFALAYAQLGSSYSNMGNTIEASPYLTKAFELRDRATEPERLYITGRYFDIVTGDLEKGSETYRLWTRIYPEDWVPFNDLANDADLMGRYDVAANAAARANELNPTQLFGRANLTTALAGLNRFDEALAAADAILAISADHGYAHAALYAIAMHRHDAAAAEREVTWSAQHSHEPAVPYAEAEAAASHGRMHEMRRLFHAVAQIDHANGNDEGAGNALAFSAVLNSVVGLTGEASSDAAEAVALGQDEINRGSAAIVAARAGHAARAREQLASISRDFPKTTVNVGIFAPMIRGALLNPARSTAAEVTSATAAGLPYEYGQLAALQPPYLRGVAYLSAHAPDLAAVEFQKIIEHIGVDPVTPLYALARLGLARADAALGRRDDSRTAYATFLDLWKDADRDVPLLREAQREAAVVH